MALSWEKLKAFGNVIKKTSVPTVADCVYDALTIWINTVTDTAYLLNGTTITVLPVTIAEVALPGDIPTAITDLESEIASIKAEYMKKSVYDTNEDGVVDAAEAIDGGTF